MTGRSFVILLIGTALLAVGAILAYSSRTPDAPRAANLLYPDLAARISDVASMTVQTDEESFTIQRTGSGWGLESKSGYPARVDKVNQALVALSQARIVEPKTSKPEMYGRIGVEDAPAAGSESMVIALKAADGGSLASLIIGTQDLGGAEPRRFVRRSGEAQSWLVQGSLSIEAPPLSWVDREILRLPRNRIRIVTVEHPDGSRVSIDREKEADASFSIRDVPEGMEPIRPGIADTLASAVSFLSLDDVATAEAIGFDPAATTTIVYETFDGFVVTLQTATIDEIDWLRVSASFVPVAEPAADDQAPTDAGNETDAGTEAETEEQPAGPPAAQAEAEKLNARTGDWIYAISSARAVNLRKRMSDFVQEIKPPAEEETAPPAGEDPGG